MDSIGCVSAVDWGKSRWLIDIESETLRLKRTMCECCEGHPGHIHWGGLLLGKSRRRERLSSTVLISLADWRDSWLSSGRSRGPRAVESVGVEAGQLACVLACTGTVAATYVHRYSSFDLRAQVQKL